MISDAGWLAGVRERVNARLERFFAAKLREAQRTSDAASELVDAVAELTMRGGKRLRAAGLHAGLCAVASVFEPERSDDAAAAIELLQTYFLIQDDWMDGDVERRGGPAVHVALSTRHGDARLGASLAILAGDVASGFAWELISAAPFPAARLREALATFARMHFEVLCGQQLDLLGHADVGLVHQLKTGSYTVRGPLALGGLLGDASAEQLAALERFGAPLGLAFQLRDDLLSTFGDAGALGKPVGNDLKAGKRTALLAEARKLVVDHSRAALDAVVGNPSASDEQVARACEVLLDSGVRAKLEARLDQLLELANAALRGAGFTDVGTARLQQLAELLARRDR